MIKIIGFIIIILGTTMMGFKYADNIKQRYRSLIYLKKTLIMLRAEIDYNESEINQIFGALGNKTKGAFKEFFISLYNNINGYYDKSINEYWNEAVEKNLNNSNFSCEDIAKIKELGDNLGYLDKKMQINNIDYILDYIDRETKELSLSMDKNMKMWKMFGVLAGVFIAIVFS